MFIIATVQNQKIYYLDKIRVKHKHMDKRYIWYWQQDTISNKTYAYKTREMAEKMINVLQKHHSNAELFLMCD